MKVENSQEQQINIAMQNLLNFVTDQKMQDPRTPIMTSFSVFLENMIEVRKSSELEFQLHIMTFNTLLEKWNNIKFSEKISEQDKFVSHPYQDVRDSINSVIQKNSSLLVINKHQSYYRERIFATFGFFGYRIYTMNEYNLFKNLLQFMIETSSVFMQDTLISRLTSYDLINDIVDLYDSGECELESFLEQYEDSKDPIIKYMMKLVENNIFDDPTDKIYIEYYNNIKFTLDLFAKLKNIADILIFYCKENLDELNMVNRRAEILYKQL